MAIERPPRAHRNGRGAKTATHRGSTGRGAVDEIAHVAAVDYVSVVPDADVDALETHLALVHTAALATAGLVDHLERAGFSTTRPRLNLLRLLYLSPERRLSLTEIAHTLTVSGAAVTQLVDILEREGWVERAINPANRRVTFAQLTPQGLDRASRLLPAIVDYMVASVGNLSPRQKLQLRSLLAHVGRKIETIAAGQPNADLRQLLNLRDESRS